MYYFRYNERRNQRSITMYNDNEMKRELSFILYHIYNEYLIIDDIGLSVNGLFYYSRRENHFGTDIFNALLYRLADKNQNFTEIKGWLSLRDACNGNWKKSISFYYDFPKWVDVSLGYLLEFHLFNNEDYTNEIILSSDKQERSIQINAFIKCHTSSQLSASFSYIVFKSTP